MHNVCWCKTEASELIEYHHLWRFPAVGEYPDVRPKLAAEAAPQKGVRPPGAPSCGSVDTALMAPELLA